MNDKKRIVVVGGGTGTYTVLNGLKRYTKDIDLTAIVAMTDSGGSTGRLRDEFGYLPVGDVRMALSALSAEDDVHGALLRTLFLHRFESDGAIHGHNFGNLFLIALTDILGSEEEAIRAASRVLRVCGRVIPVTHEKTHLVAVYADGSRIVGEHDIDEPKFGTDHPRIMELSVTPRAELNTEARKTLSEADCVIFGPGDLYTSVVANCVVDGFKEVILESNAKIVYIQNLMTKFGQTTGMTVADHVMELEKYIGRTPDFILFNTTKLPTELLKKYELDGEFPVAHDAHISVSAKIVYKDLLATEEIVRKPGDVLKRSLIRHDSDKLAETIMALLADDVR